MSHRFRVSSLPTRWLLAAGAMFLASASSAAFAASTAPSLKATATLQPKAGGTAAGTITFTQEGSAVTIVAQLTGVAAGTHGFHIHEKGDCGDADFKNAGGHFNPTGATHGAPGDAAHHAGDLGNIEIAADGSGMLSISTALLTVAEGPNSVEGRAVILHEKADDLKTQPTGDAGGRIACGVIETSAKPHHNH